VVKAKWGGHERGARHEGETRFTNARPSLSFGSLAAKGQALRNLSSTQIVLGGDEDRYNLLGANSHATECHAGLFDSYHDESAPRTHNSMRRLAVQLLKHRLVDFESHVHRTHRYLVLHVEHVRLRLVLAQAQSLAQHSAIRTLTLRPRRVGALVGGRRCDDRLWLCDRYAFPGGRPREIYRNRIGQ
jgi:hypothetical protein